jgi:hypothetical protein
VRKTGAAMGQQAVGRVRCDGALLAKKVCLRKRSRLWKQQILGAKRSGARSMKTRWSQGAKLHFWIALVEFLDSNSAHLSPRSCDTFCPLENVHKTNGA